MEIYFLLSTASVLLPVLYEDQTASKLSGDFFFGQQINLSSGLVY